MGKVRLLSRSVRATSLLAVVLLVAAALALAGCESFQAQASKLTGNRALVVIISSPSGASVYFNGTFKGTTPRKLTMPEGAYDIQLRKSGYATFDQQYSFAHNQFIFINQTLVPLTPLDSGNPQQQAQAGGTGGAQATNVYYSREAESGQIAAPMGVGVDPTASGEQHQFVASPHANNGSVRFSFTIPANAQGSFTLWTRALSSASTPQAFTAIVDGGTPQPIASASAASAGTWAWAQPIAPGTASLYTFSLLAGTHTITVRAASANAELDRIILTNDLSFSPDTTPATPAAAAANPNPNGLAVSMTPANPSTSTQVTLSASANAPEAITIYADGQSRASCAASFAQCGFTSTFSQGAHTYYAQSGNERDPATGTYSFTVSAAGTGGVSVAQTPSSPAPTTPVVITATTPSAAPMAIMVDDASRVTCSASTLCAFTSTYPSGTHTYYATSGNYRDPASGTKSFTISGGTTGWRCGDGTCNTNETCAICPADCGPCVDLPACGNGIKEGNEQCDLGDASHGNGNGASCPATCSLTCTTRTCTPPPSGPYCGDGTCQSNETHANCPVDCPATGPVCGNGVCEVSLGETSSSCASDCAANTGTIYYVSPSGSDSNAGTSASAPFKTIAKGLSVAQPGQTVHLLAGVYYEHVTFPRSGTAGNPIVLEGDSRTTSIIDGGSAGSWSASSMGPGVYQSSSPGNMAYAATWNGKALSIITTDKGEGGAFNSAQVQAWLTKPSSDATWTGVEAVYAYLNGINYFRSKNNEPPGDLRMAPTQSYAVQVNRNYITIRNLGMRTAFNVLDIESANNIIIENSKVSAAGYTNIFMTGSSSNNIIRNNDVTLDYIWSDFGHPWRDRPDGPNYRVWTLWKLSSTGDRVAIEMQSSGTNNEVANNHVYRVFDGLNEVGGNTKWHDNLVEYVADDAIDVGATATTSFYDNLIVEGGNNCLDIDYSGGQTGPLYFFRNKCYFVQTSNTGPCVYFKYIPSSSTKLWLYHNDFSCSQYSVAEIANNGAAGNNVVWVNNIFSSNGFAQYIDGEGYFDYNWIGGTSDSVSGHSSIGAKNYYAGSQLMWALTNPSWVPSGSALHSGIDLSKSFTLSNGQTYSALPGMASGYYSGAAPNMGAVQ